MNPLHRPTDQAHLWLLVMLPIGVAPCGRAAADRFPFVQVNVDADGHNIPGDAANEPSICIDPTRPNRVAIGWRQFDTVASSFREAGYAYSRDSGRTWTCPGVLEEGVFRTDPVLASDSAGNFYFLSLSVIDGVYSTQLFKSLDGGKTWPAKEAAFGGDKPWLAIDRTGGPSDGFIYEAWSPSPSCCEFKTFARSLDEGGSFQGPWRHPTVLPVWGTMAVGPTGTVYVAGRSSPSHFGPAFMVARSANAKDPHASPTFQESTVSLGGLSSSMGVVNPGGLNGQIWIEVDPSSGPTAGYVYVLSSVDPPGPDPLDVRLARSVNGAVSWQPSVRVNDDPLDSNAWQWFGTMSVAPNGRIDVIWNDTRLTSMPKFSAVFYSFSTDGGSTWSPNVQLTPIFDSTLGWPQQQKLGDYYHMISDHVGASLAFAATFHGEQDVYFLRIGDYDCNGNRVGDGDDVASGASIDFNHDGIPDECQCLADFSGDGVVDQVDLGILLAAYGTIRGYPLYTPKADANGDGKVDQQDLGILLSGFGKECP
jgi:hypothetical protein